MPPPNTVSFCDVANLVDLFSKISTIVGVIVAILGGWVALQSYRASVRNAANQLMHVLFMDYLSLSLQVDDKSTINVASYKRKGDSPSVVLAGVKLYVLEEMFNWTEAEDRKLARYKYFMKVTPWKYRQSDIESWRSTIRFQARDDKESARANLVGYTTCYGVRFLRFIADDWNEPDLQRIVAAQENAVLNSTRRPNGTKEGNT